MKAGRLIRPHGMRLALALCIVVTLARSAAAPSAVAAPGVTDRPGAYFLEWLCIDDLITPEPVFHPVGCKSIDCCVGCPRQGTIDWHIRVEGPDLGDVKIRFENLPRALMRRLRLEGEARWLDGETLLLTGREVVVRGFRVERGARPPVGFPSIVFDEDRVSAFRQGLPGGVRDHGDLGRIELTIEQFLGRVIVNEFLLVHRLRRCLPDVPQGEDQIILEGNSCSDNAVVFVDGRREDGCRDMGEDPELHRGSEVINVGNLLDPQGCANEIVVFSNDNAVAFADATEGQNRAPRWTDDPGNRTEIPLQPLIQIPVTIWLVGSYVDADDLAEAKTNVEWLVVVANMLYDTNHVGIEFVADIQDVSEDPEIKVRVPSENALGPAWVNSVIENCLSTGAPCYFRPDQVNVYFFGDDATLTGYVNTPDAPSMVAIGRKNNSQTLAHELGHLFSLFHTDPSGDLWHSGEPIMKSDFFDNRNVMWGYQPSGTRFSEGQAYRVNRQRISGERLGTSLLWGAEYNGDENNGLIFPKLTKAITSRNCRESNSNCLHIGKDAVPNY